ncbi:MAG: hypothetical protein U0231_19845 [Nitrospiraceae bacterium]
MHMRALLAMITATGLLPTPLLWAEEEVVLFAVVSEIPKDKLRVAAKGLLDGGVTDLKLLPSETVAGNPVWRKLEICHALKADGVKTSEGFTISNVRVLDASMLPMPLQGFAGDCLLKKALELAPMAD